MEPTTIGSNTAAASTPSSPAVFTMDANSNIASPNVASTPASTITTAPTSNNSSANDFLKRVSILDIIFLTLGVTALAATIIVNRYKMKEFKVATYDLQSQLDEQRREIGAIKSMIGKAQPKKR